MRRVKSPKSRGAAGADQTASANAQARGHSLKARSYSFHTHSLHMQHSAPKTRFFAASVMPESGLNEYAVASEQRKFGLR